jgi:hypothetical protein
LTEALEEGRDEALGFPPAVALPLSALPLFPVFI